MPPGRNGGRKEERPDERRAIHAGIVSGARNVARRRERASFRSPGGLTTCPTTYSTTSTRVTISSRGISADQ